MLKNPDQDWKDRRWWLAWPAALLTHPGFHRGRTLRRGAPAPALKAPGADRAEGWVGCHPRPPLNPAETWNERAAA
jgi:hypothetical protein